MTDYSFGDSDLAARRLLRVAQVFEAPTRAFLAAWGRPACALAVDLGCGPGHTTRLLREVLGCRQVVGLDASAAFVAAAQRAGGSGLRFLQHDVMDLPFPTDPADLVYARLLVSHLPEPARAIRGFSTQLRPGGRLLLDEVDWIRTGDEAFRRYLGLVETLLAGRGQCLYVGPRLQALAGTLRVRSREVREHTVDARDAATMFSLNLEQLRQNDEVRTRRTQQELDELAEQLAARQARGGSDVVWGLRQLVVEA